MKYKVIVQKTSEGFAVSVPGFPGCWSQGSTEQEALENVKDAIKSYLETEDENSVREARADYKAGRVSTHEQVFGKGSNEAKPQVGRRGSGGLPYQHIP